MPREVIHQVCDDVFREESAKRSRKITCPVGRNMDHYPPHEAERVARHELARHLLADLENHLPVNVDHRAWGGEVFASTDVILLTEKQLGDLIATVEQRVVAQCVANGWIK
jgi:hypothetical protein